MDGNLEASSLFLAENLRKESRHVDAKQDDFEQPGVKADKITDFDLELAAEIGKVLLEKNRELELLLRDSQDYTEEQILKAQFFEQQVENLRESLQNQTKAFEHLEAHNHELADLNTQLKSDYKAANGKIKRLWETIESLETKCESYKLKIDLLEEEKQQIKSTEKQDENENNEEKISRIDAEEESTHEQEIEDLFSKCGYLEEKVKSSQEMIRDMRVQLNLDAIEKEELKAEIEDISTDNQLIQHRLSSLEVEIEEWKIFAKKAQKYKKLADKYSSDVDVSFTSSVPRFPHAHDTKKRNNYELAKSSSHEILSDSSLCGPSDLLATKRHISSSVSQLNQPLKNLSVLSEMDNQYHDLVKRYERLLDKYDNHDDEATNLRAQKVQRAIQTLSWDFSCNELENNGPDPTEKSNSVENIHCDHFDDNVHLDFRKMFVEIFAKLKSTKDFDPDMKTQDDSD